MLLILLLLSLAQPADTVTVTWLDAGRVLLEWTAPGCIFVDTAAGRGAVSCDSDGSAIYPDEAVAVGVEQWQPQPGDVFTLHRRGVLASATLAAPPTFLYLPGVTT